MGRADEKQVRLLQEISEDIESVSLSDKEGWQRLAVALEACMEVVGSDHDTVNRLTGLCIEAMEAVSGKKVKNLFALIEMMAQGVADLAAFLEDAEADEVRLADCCTSLETALGRTPDETQNPDPEPEAGDYSLDDAAALLVSLDPDDTDELAGLRADLERYRDTGSCPELIKPAIGEMVGHLTKIADGQADDPDETIAEIGRLIEAALTTLDGPVPIPEAPSAEESPAEEDGPAREADAQPEKAAQPSPEVEPQAGEPTDYMPEDPDLDLIGEFITESTDLIEKAEDALLALENDPDDMESVGMIFRAFHTVKGTAAFMELDLIAEMGHHAESLLSRVRDREIQYSGGYADLSLKALDMINALINLVQEALGGAPLLKPDGYDELMVVLANPEENGVTAEEDDTAVPRLGDLLIAQGKAERDKVEKALEETDTGPIGGKLIKAKAATVKDVGQALRAQRKIKGKATVESSVRVSTSRLDRLIDMVGELVIAHSMVAQDEVITDSENYELAKKVAHTSKIVRGLQDMSMSMRMVPLKGTFNKMARLVRDLSKKIGKKVNFVTEGEDTEIDRNLVDVINDPLVHMVRNSVDHGIETPEVRVAGGKPESGTVKLSAYHSAGSVVVEIEDDGKGLNKEVILAKGLERGLVEAVDNLSDREIHNLIFEPGFSTAKEVTDVSGRGVGMDVVKRNIESLRGQAEIHSEEGRGSIFKMSLPLTLAIIDGMVVRVGEERYVIPTVSIIRSVKPGKGDISSVLNKGQMLSLQGGLIPLFRLSMLYDVTAAGNGNGKDKGSGDWNELVVVVEDDNQQAGFIIDELIGRQQVVIKSLGDTMKEIPGIAGGAIMPNGRVGLILDVGGLVRHANSDQHLRSKGPGAGGRDAVG
jgi:two-component system chemotaxis sensor kinase CheA